MLRRVMLSIGLLAAVPAMAGEMTAEEARHFVVGKLFDYTCFEGTRGTGRVYSDGSVVGSIQFQGSGTTHYAMLPANTLRVKGGYVCASLRGLPIDPCFNLTRVDNDSFRGAIAGLGFAYCDFTRHHGRVALTHGARRHREHTARQAEHGAPRSEAAPVELRPSLTADSE
ncbi:MAG TPA: hypothetical protein VFS63_15060 [Pseudolabrys sp.]|jgi:hypothetical protein|nr:hypothetical protein [Pseudolabrys sp.]